MDGARSRFLFDRDQPPVDPASEDEVIDWFVTRAPDGPGERLGAMMRGVVARQILLDTPPEVWATAQRLTALGLDRDEVLSELTRVLTAAFGHAMNPDDEPDRQDSRWYARMLASLPSPTDAEVTAALTTAAAGRPGAVRGEVVDAALAALGRPDEDGFSRFVLDALVDEGVADGELVELAGRRLVHMPSIVRGRWFTHVMTSFAREQSWLWSMSGDLAPVLPVPEVRTADGEPIVHVEVVDGLRAWHGPQGWLDSFGDEATVAVRVDADGVVTLQSVDELEPSDELLDLVRRVAADELADEILPVPIANIAAALILADPRVFTEPTARLSEIVLRAGLAARDGRVALDEEAWHAEALDERHDRLHDASDNDDAVHAAMDVLDTFDAEFPAAEDLRAALHDLDDPEVFALVLDEILELVDEDEEAADAFGMSLVTVARRPRDQAIAHHLAASIAQRLEDGTRADEYARAAARADSSFGPGIDLAAYFASVRGDAATAARLWRTLEDPDDDDLKGVVPLLGESGPKLGRNDPCWCGSGRKFKACHQGKVEQPALPDRVGWLCNKAAGFLRRSGREARGDVVDLLRERALDIEDRESVSEAAGDPVIFDAALTEGCWFERFLDTMRGVLPEDEELLAESWLLVDRTVYEFEEVRPGQSIDVRDIATGERFSVRERTLSRTAKTGEFWCARAVPDGETTQFIGAVFPVEPGREADVLALCERKDGYELCAWVRGLHAPPTLTTREGEPMVQCTARVRVPEIAAARTELDALYERDGDAWTELFDIGGGEQIVRGQLTIEDDVIEISTSSEARMERILGTLLERLPGAEVVSDEREAIRPGTWPRPPSSAGAPSSIPFSEEEREELLQMMEQRWMTEPVPALGGVTPQEAAADPTRRDSVRRLLATFPESDDPGVLMLRASRIRAELGL